MNEVTHENEEIHFPDHLVACCARIWTRSRDAAAGRTNSAEGHHLRMGWTASGRYHSRKHAELLRPRTIGGGFLGPPRRLSDLHYDELCIHCHRDVSGEPRVLWQRGVRAECQGEERQGGRYRFFRSEEHTSELQSRLHLVCRLLLEKKKKQLSLVHNRQALRPCELIATTNEHQSHCTRA